MNKKNYIFGDDGEAYIINDWETFCENIQDWNVFKGIYMLQIQGISIEKSLEDMCNIGVIEVIGGDGELLYKEYRRTMKRMLEFAKDFFQDVDIETFLSEMKEYEKSLH